MRHEGIDNETARGLKELRCRLGREVNRVPSSILDETMHLATWNIREFGKRPRKSKSLHYIAEVIGRFDLVALTEVRRNLSDLKRVMEILPPFWGFIVSDYGSDRAANGERIAYLFDKRVVRFTGLAAEADPPRTRRDGKYVSKYEWWRSPYIATFRSGNFEFMIVTVHIRWANEGKKGEEERMEPLKGLAQWVKKRSKDHFGSPRDILVVGDMNIPSRDSKLFRMLKRHQLLLPKALTELTHHQATTNLSRNATYDQILHHATDPLRFTDSAGILDFYMQDHKPLYPELNAPLLPELNSKLKGEFTYQMSDHLPLWIELNTQVKDM